MTKMTYIPILSRTIQQNYRRHLFLRRSNDVSTISLVSSRVNRRLPKQQHLSSCIHSICRRRIFSFSTTTDSATKDATEPVNDIDNDRSKILSLYRSIRKLHEKSLPTNLRDIGNKYLQSEFRTLKDTTKMTPKLFQNFMSEWEKYRQQLLQSQKEAKFGKPLPTDVQLTAEQQEQLRKLHQEVTSANGNHTNTGTDNKLG